MFSVVHFITPISIPNQEDRNPTGTEKPVPHQKIFQNPLCKTTRSSPFPIRRAGSPPERRKAAMDADKKAAGADVYDEELRDILIAISVVAKRLATKMEAAVKSETQTSEARTSQGG